MTCTLPDAKLVRERLRAIGQINADLPTEVCDFADFLADHLRDDSKLTPKTTVLAYRRAMFLWLLDGRPRAAGYFQEIVEAAFEPGFAAEARREFVSS